MPHNLARTFRSTNAIESMISIWRSMTTSASATAVVVSVMLAAVLAVGSRRGDPRCYPGVGHDLIDGCTSVGACLSCSPSAV
jgi:anti-sigma-K factor RskA